MVRPCRALMAGAVVATLAGAASPARAADSTPAAGALLSRIQQRAATAISLRETTIARLESLVAQSGSWAGADASVLAERLRSDAAGLTTLGQQISGDADARTAWADFVRVFDQYRVYALVDPVVHFVHAADMMDVTVVPRLTSAERTLRSLVRQEKKEGRDVSAAARPMKDLAAQIRAISSVTNGLSARLLALTPADWNADHAVLAPPLADLQKARVAVARAVTDARTVESVLR